MDWPLPGPKINSLRLSPNLNSLLLFKITKNPSPSLPGMTPFTSPVTFLTWGFYSDICDCHILPVRAWTPALMSAPTHALSRKVLSITKPKDKIYKTKNDNIKKSFRNYITIRIFHFPLNRSINITMYRFYNGNPSQVHVVSSLV